LTIHFCSHECYDEWIVSTEKKKSKENYMKNR
jgi:hypothetical protein